MALIVGAIIGGICSLCIAISLLLWCLKKRKNKLEQDARDAALYEPITGTGPRYKAQVQLKLKQVKHADRWPGQEETTDEVSQPQQQQKPATRGHRAKGKMDPRAFAHWQALARRQPEAYEAAVPRDYV